MRYLICGINYSPELTGIGKYSGEMGAWLKSKGHDVLVITAAPYYPDWKVHDGWSSWRYLVEDVDGAKVIRCPFYVPRKPTGLTRIVHLASFAISAFPVVIYHALFWRPEVVLTIEPPFMAAPCSWLAARLCGAKAWLHIQDFEIDAAFELGILRWKPLRYLVNLVERWIMRRFDRVSTISSAMVKKLEKKGVAEACCVYFPNWVDLEAIYPLNGRKAFRKELDIADDSFVLLYSGNMGKKQGLETIIEAARLMAGDERIVFALCGDGAVKPNLEEMARNLSNVRFFPLQPADRLNELLNMADIHLLLQRAGAEDLVMPSKLIGMMASGRPVLATARPASEVASLVAQCGVVTPPGDMAAFADAIKKMSQDVENLKTLGREGRALVKSMWGKEEVLGKAFFG